MIYETDRLIFEPIGADHAAALFPALSDPLVYEHLGCDPPPSVEWLSGQFARIAAGPPPHGPDEQWLNFGVRLKADGQWIGRIEAIAHQQYAEVAYLFGPAHWGRGYAAESVGWLQQYLRIVHGVSEFWATTAPANDRSIRLLLRSGYVPTALADDRPLSSYEPGDKVFRLQIDGRHDADRDPAGGT